jgi:hypothetical protein
MLLRGVFMMIIMVAFYMTDVMYPVKRVRRENASEP